MIPNQRSRSYLARPVSRMLSDCALALAVPSRRSSLEKRALRCAGDEQAPRTTEGVRIRSSKVVPSVGDDTCVSSQDLLQSDRLRGVTYFLKSHASTS
jgi:hypothetical protein